jgi:hypothetical protein
MKKGTKVLLHFILAGIVSFISYLGFKKGMEALDENKEES